MSRLDGTRIGALCLAGLLCLGGCPGITLDLGDATITIPGRRVVTVTLINDTDHAVDPAIVYDDDTGFLARLFPAERLDVGVLAAGEVLDVDLRCDDLGSIRSDEAEQHVRYLLFGETVYEASASTTLERGDQFECGDAIQFQFLGNANNFRVVVSVNGRAVN
jgi:hypothetical protein